MTKRGSNFGYKSSHTHRGRVSIGDFCWGGVDIEGCSEVLCIFFFSLHFRYIVLVHGSCDHFDIHCTYILYILIYVFFTYPYMCCFFSLFMHMLLISCMQFIIFVLHKDALMSFI